MGWTPVYVRSFAVGLAYLMPLEMSFSIWFFYWFWKAQRILGSALGLDVMPGFPYDWQQVMGGYSDTCLSRTLGWTTLLS